MNHLVTTVKRKRLPDRRPHEVLDFEHAGFRFTAGLGRYDDGKLGEIFLNVDGKVGTAVETGARDAAIVASLALQHGVTPEMIRHAVLRNSDDGPAGPLGAVLDLIAAEVGQ
jgi:hypothetical protein